MSKTSNYQLTLWDWEDEERLGEVNENFARLDEKAVQIVIGSYIGDGRGEREFDLGFPPKAVILVNDIGVFNSSGTYGGVAGAGWSNDDFQLTANGFLLKRAASPLYRNSKNTAYFGPPLRYTEIVKIPPIFMLSFDRGRKRPRSIGSGVSPDSCCLGC